MSETTSIPALPTGFTVRLCPRTHRCDDDRTLVAGGSVVRLAPTARPHLRGGAVQVRDGLTAQLARELLNRGLAEPWWPLTAELPAIDERLTVVVPVLDRPEALDRLLRSLPPVPVVVVDDGSRDFAAIAVTCRRHSARLLRHSDNRGPAAARNTGLRAVRTPWVAFIDSDVVVDPASLRVLMRHLRDPHVGVVAPRILGLAARGGALSRYEAACSSLDLGPDGALVRPHASVSYVPSAMLLARTAAVTDGFDETMPVAEDVDLVWRVGRQWDVRYEPRAVVRHEHRTAARAWFSRKVCYGTGAALLASRHGSSVAPAILSPWSVAVTGSMLAQRRWSPVAGGIATLVAQQSLARRLTWSDRPQRDAVALVAAGLRGTLRQTSSAVTRHYVPLTLGLAPFSRRARRAYLIAAVGGGLADYRRTRPDLDPLRYLALRAVDDLAYGLGLWTGALTARSARALVPVVRRGAPPPDTTRTKGRNT